jgi:hypothetical protein
MAGSDDNSADTLKRATRLLAEMVRRDHQRQADRATRTTRLRVNKRTHRIRFEHESEAEVDVVIEPRNETP